MDFTHLGRTGLKVSRVALGTMNFGELTDKATSFAIMDEALDAGINVFDSADVYGGAQSPDGCSTTRLSPPQSAVPVRWNNCART